ncbi:hypothetical protein GOEFS_045_00010, partial [Gordonia effusa NBRC 100432]
GAEGIKAAATASPLFAKYGTAIDRESAYELLTAKVAPPPAQEEGLGASGEVAPPESAAPAPTKEEPGMITEVLNSPAMKSFLRSAASAAGREISRSIFGTAKRRR